MCLGIDFFISGLIFFNKGRFYIMFNNIWSNNLLRLVLDIEI